MNHTHFLKSHLHIFYKSIFYMISIISNFYKVGLFILFVQCIFPPASRSFACFFKEATIEIRSVAISASATNRSDALIRGRQQSACMPNTQSSNKIRKPYSCSPLNRREKAETLIPAWRAAKSMLISPLRCDEMYSMASLTTLSAPLHTAGSYPDATTV